MKTQIGQSPGITPVPIAAPRLVNTEAQTEGAIKPAVSLADAGEEFRSQAQEVPRSKPAFSALDPNARLTIEQDEVSGDYVYKTINRETGEVIRQWPREKLLKAIADNQDISGLVVDKKI